MIAATQPFHGIPGILLQLAGALLLAGVFVLLRSHARRRPYFITWGRAWLALLVANAALATRHVIRDAAEVEVPPHALALDLLYQLAMLLFLLLLAAGVLQLVRAGRLRPALPAAVVLAVGYATASVLATSTVTEVLALLAAVMAPVFGWCAVRALTLPQARRGVGLRLAGAAFAALAVVAVTDLLVFTGFGISGTAPLLRAVASQRVSLDLLLYMMLGLGMIVLLMEDAKREVDDAHAQLAVAHNELRRTALIDAVTGTLTRRAFAEGVGLEVAKAGFGAVMMLDVDDLKNVNDEHGHSAGDALLRHLADVLRPELRPSDKLYRWGGDEFLLILPGADATRADARIRSVLGSAPPLVLAPSQAKLALAISVGCAPYSSADSIAAAIDGADAAMYRAKSGRKFGRSSGTVA